MQSETAQPKAVKQSPMDELIQEFAIQLERLDKNNDRLRKVSNRVQVDRPPESDSEKGVPPERFGEGLLYAINGAIEKLQAQNSTYDYILSRLESFI